LYVKKNKHTTCNANGKTCNVYEGIKTVSLQITKSSFKIVFKHTRSFSYEFQGHTYGLGKNQVSTAMPMMKPFVK